MCVGGGWEDNACCRALCQRRPASGSGHRRRPPCLYLAATLSSRPWLPICCSQLKSLAHKRAAFSFECDFVTAGNVPACELPDFSSTLAAAATVMCAQINFNCCFFSFFLGGSQQWNSCRLDIPVGPHLPPSSPNNHLWPSAMMKQQATQESEKRKSLWRWQSSIQSAYKLSWKKTLVKGLRLYWTGAVTSDKAQCNRIGDPRFAEGRGRGWAGAGWLVAANAPFTQRLFAPSFLAKSARPLASLVLHHGLHPKTFGIGRHSNSKYCKYSSAIVAQLSIMSGLRKWNCELLLLQKVKYLKFPNIV